MREEIKGKGYTIVKDDEVQAYLGDFTAEKFMQLKKKVGSLEKSVKAQDGLLKSLNMQIGRLKKRDHIIVTDTKTTNKEINITENGGE